LGPGLRRATSHLEESVTASKIVECHPLTPERWRDFTTLFGKNGACSGCWCMYWRLPGPVWSAGCGETNKRRFARVIREGREPGLIAYADGEPAAWCSIAPREEFTRLERSPTRKRIDDLATWSITCFFTARPYRNSGLMRALIAAALAYARQHGAQAVEAFPSESKTQTLGSGSTGYMGLASTFRGAGFKLEEARVNGKPVKRYRYVFSVGLRRVR